MRFPSGFSFGYARRYQRRFYHKGFPTSLRPEPHRIAPISSLVGGRNKQSGIDTDSLSPSESESTSFEPKSVAPLFNRHPPRTKPPTTVSGAFSKFVSTTPHIIGTSPATALGSMSRLVLVGICAGEAFEGRREIIGRPRPGLRRLVGAFWRAKQRVTLAGDWTRHWPSQSAGLRSDISITLSFARHHRMIYFARCQSVLRFSRFQLWRVGLTRSFSTA